MPQHSGVFSGCCGILILECPVTDGCRRNRINLVDLDNSSRIRVEDDAGIDFLVKQSVYQCFCISELGNRQFSFENFLTVVADSDISLSGDVVENAVAFLFLAFFRRYRQGSAVAYADIDGLTRQIIGGQNPQLA